MPKFFPRVFACVLVGAHAIGVSAQSARVDLPGVKIDADAAGAGKAAVQVPGAAVKADGKVRSSQQTNTAEVTSNGNDVTIRNGVVVNTQSGPGARATMNIGGKQIPATTIPDTKPSRSEAKATRGAALQQGNDYVNQALRGVAWRGRDLRGATFTNTDLQGADLAGANLAGASLVNVDASHARLAGANLRDANLVNVELDGADLSNAVWTDGRLCRAGSNGACR